MKEEKNGPPAGSGARYSVKTLEDGRVEFTVQESELHLPKRVAVPLPLVLGVAGGWLQHAARTAGAMQPDGLIERPRLDPLA